MRRIVMRSALVPGPVFALLLGAGEAGAKTKKPLVPTVFHGTVSSANSAYTGAAPTGPSVGDVRSCYLPLARKQGRPEVGSLIGTRATVWIDRPAACTELRTPNLGFAVGSAASQIVLDAVGAHAETAPTVAQKSTLVRPVVGGSGANIGGRGWCLTTHYAGGTW